MTKLGNYVSKIPEFQKLPEGISIVRLVSYKVTDSFHNYDGTLKAELPSYVNPCEQLAVTVIGTSNPGGMTHRINMEGYMKYNKLTDDEVESGKFTDVNSWACAVNPKTGKLERIVDEDKTRTCEGMLDQFFAAAGLPEGSSLEDLDVIMAEKAEFQVNVVNEPYEGKDQLRISQFKKAPVTVDSETSDMDA